MIELKNVSKFYYQNGMVSTGFTKINLKLNVGEFVVITGESGSGKSTLLNVISGLDSYEEGEMYIDGVETSHYTEKDFEEYRRKYISNIFQNFNLVNSYTVYQNICLVLLLDGNNKKDIKDKVLELIDKVGLTKFKNTKVSKLSGGQKQRVAIARALALDTPIIVADEPTGNLDSKSGKQIMKLLHDVSKDKLVILVSHNREEALEYATRIISMHDGRVIEDKKIKEIEEKKLEDKEYKNITFLNKLYLGFKNTFNILPKFLLIFVVFFVLSFTFLYEYSGFKRDIENINLSGSNMFFYYKDLRRIVINKKDRSSISNEDFEKISHIDHVYSIFKQDTLLDNSLSLENDQGTYIGGMIGLYEDLDEVTKGRLPINSNEAVVYIDKSHTYLAKNIDNYLDKTMHLYDPYSEYTYDITIVGFKISEKYMPDNYIYLHPDFYDNIDSRINLSSSHTFFKLNSYINYTEYYSRNLEPSPLVPKGSIYIPENLEYSCPYFNCTNNVVKVNVENPYYEEEKEFKVTQVFNEKNYKSILNTNKKYEDVSNYSYINPSDYDELYKKDIYQSSVFVDDIKSLNAVEKELNDMGFDTLVFKDSLVDEGRTMSIVLEIVSSLITVFLVFVLFFVAYFVIKLILRSRNIYFTTIRILGATKKIARQILDIELFINASISYLCALFIIYLTYRGVLDLWFKDLIPYMSLKLYIVIYLILILISQLISRRFARKIFTKTIMKTYREEVE